jgi:hypothetical protein
MKGVHTLKNIMIILTVIYACSLLASCAAEPPVSHQMPTTVKYAVKVHEFEGCECNPVCPCIFSSDTTFGDCRGITVFTFTEGRYGTTVLKDVSCVLVFTWAGKNMEANMGKWKGVLYTSDTGTRVEREAITGLLRVMMGDAFATLDQRTAPIRITRHDDLHDLTVGTVARLHIHGIKGPNGEITKVVNAPSPLAFPVMSCALADVNTYDDGTVSWSFTGRNGFYADFDLSNIQ